MRSPTAEGVERLILDEVPYGVLAVAPDGAVEYWNPAARRMLARFVEGADEWRPEQGLPEAVQDIVAGTSDSCVIDRVRFDVVPGPGDRRVLTFRDLASADDDLAAERERRRAAERTAHEQREFIEVVLDSIPTGIVACDERGKLRLFNGASRNFHGLPEAPLAPEEWARHYDLYRPDGTTLLRKEQIPLYRAFQGETVTDAELVIAPKKGHRRTVLCSGRPMFGRDGRKIGALIGMRDVTHRKISTARVREAFRQFRALFNDAPVAYQEIDRDGVIRRVNRAQCRLLGRDRREIVGKYAWEFVAGNEREECRQAIRATIEGAAAPAPVERNLVRVNGARIVVELHENAMTDRSGHVAGIRSAMLDITDRKRRQEQAQAILREKTAREQAEAASDEIRSILERIGDAYIAFDTDWRYTYVNQKAVELSLRPASELLGKCVWDEFPESVHTLFYDELHRSFREQVSVTFENFYAPLDKWFENTVYPSPSGVAVFYRDVTERKRTQHSLELRTAQLAHKNAELEAFAYMASHDLQEPLRVITTYTSLLSTRYSDRLDEDAEAFIGFATDAAGRMRNLVTDLLALCRAGALDVARVSDIGVAGAVEQATAQLAGLVAESGATIQCANLPRVRAVENHLVQLFQNLIGNAIRYRSERPPAIVVSARRLNARWELSVADNGQGFDMRYAEQIFQPFKRLMRDDKGTGIGLAICKKIVETRGGRIWVDSAVGVGSTFYFDIPDDLPTAV